MLLRKIIRIYLQSNGKGLILRKKVLVVGAGKTGVATANFLATLGVEVTLNDKNKIKEKLNLNRKVKVVDNGHYEKLFKEAELIVVSPGVDISNLKWIEGKDVIGDVELFSWFDDSKIVAITGTNGKTTTTFLTGEILKKKYKVFVGGNIGTPVLERFLPYDEKDFSVLELSSFQLETVDKFYADIAVILNITPDHLNRYRSFEDYKNAKLNILKNSKQGQYVILNSEIKNIAETDFMGNVIFFSGNSFFDTDSVKVSFGDKEMILDKRLIKLRGAHFYEDIYVASLIGLINDVPEESIKEVVYGFKGLEHRLEFVKEKNGIFYYNDSKSTTVSSTVRGVESFENNVVLILCGVYKGESFKELEKCKNLKSVICFGEAAGIITEELEKLAPINVKNMEEAVDYAKKIAEKGDTILLSPACASFDMFDDYVHRGNFFKELINNL